MESSDSSNQRKISDRNSSVDSVISISQIFDFVKENDEKYEKDNKEPIKFNPKPVNPALLKENGMPKVLYHGTNAEFSTINTNTEYRLPFFTTTDRKSGETFGKI